MSFTATAFFGVQMFRNTEVIVNPEISAGRGFGQVTGIAGFPNGEITRVSSVAPALYVARAYLRQVWAIGSGTEDVKEEANQLGGKLPLRRFSWVIGKFAMTDFFDRNRYANDPRGQFLNWALMTNGAWDFPADTRGYTVGTVLELTMKDWSLRAAMAAEPKTANGPRLDWRLTRNRGTAAEWEGRYSVARRAGALRVLAYLNRANAGTFRQALSSNLSDLSATRRSGTRKYGFGLNFDQEISSGIGIFGRYGWNDGKTESFAFTQIDRTITGGIDLAGKSWRRTEDHLGIAAIRNYVSGDQRRFLSAGGLGFIIGDGRLSYQPETTFEIYYGWRVAKEWTVTADYQHIQNPAYNLDRGPVTVASIRIHWGK